MKVKATPKKYAQTLYDLIKDANEKEALQLIDKFSALLIKNNQTSQLEKIANYFGEIWDMEKGLINANIISANKIDSEIENVIKVYVQNKARKNLKNITVENQIDEELIGGFVLRYNDKILDQSVKRKIAQLKKKMAS